MSRYFEFSQNVKNEVNVNRKMIKKLNDHMKGKRMLPQIGKGFDNTVYRAGRLENGLYLALRYFNACDGWGNTPTALKFYDSYAQEAERYFECGIRVPVFCIGLVAGRDAALLVEDLTAGGRMKIRNVAESEYGYFEDSNEKVAYDFDMSHIGVELKFMSDGAVIRLY
jgi:hypothetical protein